MNRNAFISDRFGKVHHFEPDFARRGTSETILFNDGIEQYTEMHGGAICLSPTITIDALMSLREIIQDELQTRAQNQLKNI